MNDTKRALLKRIEEESDSMVQFLSGFLRVPSPNPPGDTRAVAEYVSEFLDERGIEHRVVAGREDMPNIVASFDCPAPGRHMVFNGHMDVFPVDENVKWKHGPWSGTVEDGRIYGRGACDMKAGTSASIFAFLFLRDIVDQISGRVTLTVVSDEETFGPWGAQYLFEHERDVPGDCCICGEPSAPETYRFGERGLLWLRFTARTRGAHGAYEHLSPSASKICVRLIGDLERALGNTNFSLPPEVEKAITESSAAADDVHGKGGAGVTGRVTLNIGTIQGGVKVNVIPSSCSFDADIRLPPGVARKDILPVVSSVMQNYPEVEMKELNYSAPNWSDPYGEMTEFLRSNAVAVGRPEPVPVMSLGGTDTRFWRNAGVPAYVYGPRVRGMAAADEHVTVDEFLHTVRMHTLCAFDFLSACF